MSLENSPLRKNAPISVGQLHYYHTDFYYSMPSLNKTPKMHGVKRVLVFCILIVILPATLIILPLYLRKTVFADVIYPVAESDIIEIRDGISSIFCEQHTLRMNTNFNAFQLRNRPEISTNRKHIRLKKSMTLPDDTLEYWGFYLLKGARVQLKFCSRYDGSRILVVKGQRELKLCGLLDHNKNKLGANLAQGHEQVKVFFEDIKEIAENLPTDAGHSSKADNADAGDIHERENHGGEDLSYDDITEPATTVSPTLTTTSTRHPRKKLKKGTNRNYKSHSPHETEQNSNGNSLVEDQSHHLASAMADDTLNSGKVLNNRTRRHSMHKRTKRDHRKNQQVYDQLFRTKRDHLYDRKYSHGGNAINFTETDESNSVSSFESSLFECFNGAILLAEGFPPMSECTNAHFLENGSHRMFSEHQITSDGYYYYIFYSDNDLVRNDIHAIFDIYKPTFQYSNISDSQGCVNTTNCTFPIGFLSDEIVVVEVPTRDGIEHEDDDITTLISTCHPRTEIYALFPITVLILILSCSFL